MGLSMSGAALSARATKVHADGAASPARLEKSDKSAAHSLNDYFDAMSARLGPMNWWSAKTAFEVIVGAILTQSTAWTNVKLALVHLRREKLLSPRAIANVSEARPRETDSIFGILPAKSKKAEGVCGIFGSMCTAARCGECSRLPHRNCANNCLRCTASAPRLRTPFFFMRRSIQCLWWMRTQRDCSHGMACCAENARYEEVQTFLESHLRRDVNFFNEYHALIVNVGKRWCRKRAPLCAECPLSKLSASRFAIHLPRKLFAPCRRICDDAEIAAHPLVAGIRRRAGCVVARGSDHAWLAAICHSNPDAGTKWRVTSRFLHSLLPRCLSSA